MRNLIKRLLKEALEIDNYHKWDNDKSNKATNTNWDKLETSNYRKWAINNSEMAHKAWSTHAHLYDNFFLSIKDKRELKNLTNKLLPKLDEHGKKAFIVFYLYKQDVLDGALNEGELR